MAEFQKVMKEWVRARKAINEDMLSCFPLEMFSDDCIANIEKEVMAWAAEHPEPVYPTWVEWFREIGVVPPEQKGFHIWLHDHIPADIAQKLGLQPKEGI